MSEAKWSPEPWSCEGSAVYSLRDDQPTNRFWAGVQSTQRAGEASQEECVANARRIVACVNACQGIPTEALEIGALGKALDLAVQVVNTGTPLDHIPGSLEAGVALVRAIRALGRLK